MTDNGSDMLEFIRELYPVCRSITGNGVRQTLRRISEEVPVEVQEIESGTEVFDWVVPDEWNISEAYIDGPDGERVVDFRDNSLHVVSYSEPIDATMTLAELKPHLHTIPEQPNWIPYRTSYYRRNWGFCLSHRQFSELPDGEYSVKIESKLDKGSLTFGELVVPGGSEKEILVWSHCCHPSLCNDNLSGLAVTVRWARHLLDGPTPRFSYRFVWGPGTIGSITWLAQNEGRLKHILGGFVAVLLGRPGDFHYKRSRQGSSLIDRVAERVLSVSAPNAEVRDFDPYGYDERQFGSPGIDISMGRLSRVPHGEYPEYHTSADNLDLIDANALVEALGVCLDISMEFDAAEIYRNLAPKGEPQLGKRGLYRQIGGDNVASDEFAMLWVLNQSDGEHSLTDIAARSGISLESLRGAATSLVDAGLLEPV